MEKEQRTLVEGKLIGIARSLGIPEDEFYRRFYGNLKGKSKDYFRNPKDFNLALKGKESFKLYEVGKQEFHRSKSLQKKYGIWTDTDKDGVPNWVDCYPFNEKRQGFFSKIGNAIKNAVSNTVKAVTNTVSNAYKSVDSKVFGGNLPGGAPSSSSGSSNKGSSGGSSSNSGGSSGGGSGGGSYNPITHAYTDPFGNMSSMQSAPEGAVIINYTPTTNTYDSKTGTYTDSSGNKSSMVRAPTGAYLLDGGMVSEVKKKESNKNVLSSKDLSKVSSGNMSFAPKIMSELPKYERDMQLMSKIPQKKNIWGNWGGEKGDTTKKNTWKHLDAVDYYSKEYLPRFVEQVPIIVKDLGVSLAKGGSKAILYANDEVDYLKNLKHDKDGFYIPADTKLRSDDVKWLKDWSGYDWNTNPILDPDYQNLGLTVALGGIGGASATGGKVALAGVQGYSTYEAVKNPSDYNIATAGLAWSPTIAKGVKKLKARGDIIVADTGELVPLKDRITQVDKIIDNQGKSIETVTSKRSSKAGLTNKPKGDIDYTYDKDIQFGTYKVGEVYPTSEYFLKNPKNKIFKTGNVEIMDTKVQSNAGTLLESIKKDLLKNGRTDEVKINKLYDLAKKEANKLGEPVATVSPKRLRGYHQAEQEIVKVIPDKWKGKDMSFGGWTESGHKVYTDKPFTQNVKDFIKSKLEAGSKQKTYWDEIAREKEAYLKGRESIKGEYAGHGREHLLPFDKYNPAYKYHDIMKVSDIDSFSKFPHGEQAMKWAKDTGMNPEIAKGLGGHEYARFNVKSLFTKPEGGITLPSPKQVKWFPESKMNPYLQDIATLDRLDLVRYGRKVNRNMLSEDALKRLFGDEKNIKQTLKKLNKVAEKAEAEGVKYNKELPYKVEYIDELGRKGYGTYDPYKNEQYKIPYTKDYEYEGKEKDYNPYYKGGDDYVPVNNYEPNYNPDYTPNYVPDYNPPYNPEPTPYEPYSPYEPKNPYVPQVPYSPNVPYEPNVPYTPNFPIEIREPPIREPPKVKDWKSENKKVIAWQPVLIMPDGSEIKGQFYKNPKEASNEGMIATDNLPNDRFKLEPREVEEAIIKPARNSNSQYKFNQRGGLFVEKANYRKDKMKEMKSNFKWSNYVMSARAY